MAADIIKPTQRRPLLQQRSASHASFTNPSSVREVNYPLPQRPTIVRSSSSAATTIIHQSPTTSISLVDSPEQDDIDDRPTKRAKIEDDTRDGKRRRQTLKLVVGKSIGLPYQIENQTRPAPARLRGENAARRANGISPPAIAVTLSAPPQPHVADFFPWNGLQPEDRLDEQVVKNGYADKALSANQNESNTARQTLWSGSSQKSHLALHNLSLLYAQVLEKRQISGRFTAQSTFRPPPRVTVTDTKRETWLRDLANPSIPLRRQSRTIPHGVRGKLLLEQCIAKNVPLQRAVWLAKCVGANELRAFKRKGANGLSSAQGEAKWIQDWTISVEHFFQSITHSSTQTWQQNLEYAMKLVHALFSEALLENDHFLDWLVTSSSSSSIDLLPLWLLMINTYWLDIIAFERRGRRLALAILEQLSRLANTTSEYEPLRKRLQTIIEKISSTVPSCLVLPNDWSRYEKQLRQLPAFGKLCSRNQRLCISTCQDQNRDPLSELYHLLDSADFKVDVQNLANRCVNLIPETDKTVAALVRYASTPYRNNSGRLFLVQHLIAQFALQGADIDSALLSILSNADQDVNLRTVFTLIADLVVKGFAYAGRYMQWLIITGMMTSKTSVYSGLLQALPADKLPQHLQNTRISLLERLNTTQEAHNLSTAITSIETAIKNGLMSVELPPLSRGSLDPWTVQFLHQCKDNQDLSLSTFCVLRTVLERCGRFEALHTLLEAFISTDDCHTLGTVADTINLHSLSFAINSQLHPLVDAVMQRYRKLRTTQPLERSCIHALHDLIERLSAKKSVLRLLDNDLIIYEQQNLNAVCSPASDSLVNMRADSIENDDEIDAVFASGDTMDEGLMKRILDRIMHMANKRLTTNNMSSRICGWLAQLQLLDRLAFDRTIRSFLANIDQSEDTLQALQAIVASDCLSMKQILEYTKDIFPANTRLALLMPVSEASTFLSKLEIYHFTQRQRSYIMDCKREVAELLKNWLITGQLSAIADATEIVLDLAASPDLIASITSATAANAQQLFETVLRKGEKLRLVEEMSPNDVASNSDALNAHFCAAWFRAYTLSHKSEADQDQCKDALIEAVRNGNTSWSPILAACGPEIVKHLHTWALHQTLSVDKASAEYWTLLDATFAVVKSADNSAVLAMLSAKLTALEKTFASPELDIRPGIEALQSLLHIIAICSDGTATNQEVQNRMAAVLSLCKILASKRQLEAGIIEYLRDVVSIQLDLLPREQVCEIGEKLKQGGLRSKSFVSLFGMRKFNDDSLSLAAAIRPNKIPNPGGRPTLSLSAGMNDRASQRFAQPTDYKYAPYVLKRWDVIQEPTPVVGENDSSINLSLFGARKVY